MVKLLKTTVITITRHSRAIGGREFTGRVSDEELIKITAAAYAITYVPIFESFGVPLVEAMQCGVPVITSNITSMPEVVEDAGFLVNPFSEDEMLKL